MSFFFWEMVDFSSKRKISREGNMLANALVIAISDLKLLRDACRRQECTKVLSAPFFLGEDMPLVIVEITEGMPSLFLFVWQWHSTYEITMPSM